MADSKITDLSADTAPSTDDLVTTVNDPGGTPGNRKVTVANFMTAANLKNPYKFSVYRNSAQNTGNGAFAIINFDTEIFDTNSNFDVATNVGRYTAPVAGFYQFNSRVAAAASTQLLIALYKNGSVFHRGTHALGNGTYGVGFNELVQSAANDYWEIYSFGSGGALEVASGGVNFSGFLVSIT